MKKALFIDRDGTLILEPSIEDNQQVDSLELLTFYPGAFTGMAQIAKLDYELVMVSNQDGLGTESYPLETFYPAHYKTIEAFKGEGVEFDAIFIDPSMPEENSPNRKPGTGMLTDYMKGDYNLENSYVIGDRLTDIQLAKNLDAKGILLLPREQGEKLLDTVDGLRESCALVTDKWNDIYEFLRHEDRTAKVERKTKETDIRIEIDLDGRGKSSISTGLNFFDHMLDQIAHHSGISLVVDAKGDLQVDAHHTIEDTGIALGEAIKTALGDKRGIGRYGFALPMDESRATVLMDFGGRISFSWKVKFRDQFIGDVPSEMFEHFFESLAAAAQMNLQIKAKGSNQHHKIEAVFKAFARALRMAIQRNPLDDSLPSSKGVL